MIVRRERRRPSLAGRMIGPLIVLLAVAVWPAAVFAADATVDAPSNAVVVFIVILLLLGSVTAGLFFASPFRKRLTSSAMEPEAVVDAHQAGTRRSVYSPLIPAEPATVPPLPARPAPVPQPTTAQAAPVQPPMPARPAPVRPPHVILTQPAIQPRPIKSPWSTGSPQLDTNWQPRRRGTP